MTNKAHLKIFIILLVCYMSVSEVKAQVSSTTLRGADVVGLVIDSVKKERLSSINISIVSAATGLSLLTTQTNSEGIFKASNIPIKTLLRIKIASANYETYVKVITIDAEKGFHDLGTILFRPKRTNAQDFKSPVKPGEKTTSLSSIGKIIGRVRDSVYRNVLSSATVSVYNFSDSNLLKFTIPNTVGEFNLQELPIDNKLKLLITHVGYTPYEKLFTFDTTRTSIDLGWIDMNQNSGKENVLQEIAITGYAPVRMNGDTLEFNPKAFHMEENATTEDLMRKLPGMVIWGDGDITFNGKKINSLLVNGKPFMGNSDITTATQNLPKDVLEKVQIYSQRDDKNPLDSTLNANLKLKYEKKIGYFGKIGAGYGTNGRFSSEGMISGYNKKLQIATVGAFNNINKSASDINTLIRNSSYQGEGNRMDYQSDFKRSGINTGTTAGTRFQYDFIPETEEKKSRRLIADFFYKRDDEDIRGAQQSKITLQTDNVLMGNTINQNRNVRANSTFNADYAEKNKEYSLTISADANVRRQDNNSQTTGEQTRIGRVVEGISNSSSLKHEDNIHKSLAFEAFFNFQKKIEEDSPSYVKAIQILSQFNIEYKFDHDEDSGQTKSLSSIVSSLNPGFNELFDRLYEIDNRRNGHTLNLIYPKLKQLLFGRENLGGIELEISAKASFFQNSEVAEVSDKSSTTSLYEKNEYLTNSRRENTQSFQPRIALSKNFFRGLTNRYSQRLDILVVSSVERYDLRSIAKQEVQSLNYGYSRFLPSASLQYNNHQYGDFQYSSAISYRGHVNYPTILQIAPLVDSANLWFIPKGNVLLNPEYINTFAVKMSLESRKPKNPYKIDLDIDANLSENKFSDSSFYDNLGRRINYIVNLKGNKYWHLGSTFRKSYSPNKSNTFRATFWYNHFYYRIPQFLDAYLLVTDNRNNNLDGEIAYNFLNIVAINAKQGISFYRNLQQGSNLTYSGSNLYTRFTGSLQLPKNLTWTTNIDFNTSKARNQSTIKYAIWNASLNYRFMKGNQAELRFSAMDLLRQNKSIINNTNRNVQTFGYSNVLRQYFMLNLSYYPRKFDKS